MMDNTGWCRSLKARTQESMQLCIRMHLTAIRGCSWGQWFGVRKWPSALHITRRAGTTGMTAAVIQNKKPLYVCTLTGHSHGTSKLLKEADSGNIRTWNGLVAVPLQDVLSTWLPSWYTGSNQVGTNQTCLMYCVKQCLPLGLAGTNV